MPPRLKLIVSYDGGSYSGWQSQRNHNAIQDHLELALRHLVSKPLRVHGAGRTDAGVHALAQCAHVDLPVRRYEPDRWIAALNGVLPRTIRVLRCRFVSPTFHARFSAKGKIYRYRIWNEPVLPPFEIGRAWHITSQLDLNAIADAADAFCGPHDFASFSANSGSPRTNTTRIINAVRVRRSGPCVSIEFEGDGFLYKMVRMMVATLVRIGLDKSTAREITLRLASPQKQIPHGRDTAPAEGLYLVRIRY